jgi:hypothetical protein
LLSFIQGIFAAAEPGCYHWSPEEDQSEIYLSAATPVHVKEIGQRPAVTLTCGPIQFISVGLDDMTNYKFDTGQKEKTVLAVGTMSINCSARLVVPSRQLAAIIWEHIWLLREILLRAGFFEIGRQMGIGATSNAEGIIAGDNADEWFTTPIICPFQFSRTSRFTPLGQRIIQSIDASIQAAQQRLTGLGAPMAPGTDLPYALNKYSPDAFAPSASDARGATPDPGGDVSRLPLLPHPLYPGQLVRARIARGSRAGVHINQPEASIPIDGGTVEQSALPVTDPQLFKV